MGTCRTIFEKLFKKDIFDDLLPFEEYEDLKGKECSYKSDNSFFGLAGIAAQTIHAGDMVSINQNGNIEALRMAQQQEDIRRANIFNNAFFSAPYDGLCLFTSKKRKPSLDEILNPRYRKYKAYLERCYG